MNKNTRIATAFIVAVACLFSVIAEQKAFAGSLAAWGYNGWGQCDVPADNKFFTAIAGGYGHSLALKSDGSLVAWGRNDYGQCDVPAGNYTAIAAGDYHSLALKSDGSLVAWGDNDYGQCNVPADNNFVAIAAGGYHCLAMKSDGSVVAWGNNDYGQCNVPAGNYTAIAAGYLHSLALKSDGSLVGWGDNYFGQCNVPAGNYTAIAAGYRHNLALKSDGSLAAWGWNYWGQCDVPAGNYTAIAAGTEHSLALKSDGSLAAWGDNDFGQCNVPAGNNFTVIAAGSYHNLAIFLTPIALLVTPSGGLSSFGVQGGPFSPASKTYTLTNTGEQSLAWTAGKTQNWVSLDQTSGTLAGYAGTTVTVSINSNANSLAAGHYFDTVSFTNTTNGNGNTTRSVALHPGQFAPAGSLAAWGDNGAGEATPPSDNNNFIAISAGEYHNLALKSDHSIVAWGWNNYGEATLPSDNNNFIAISAGGYHSLALKSDGSIVAWGWNYFGEATPPSDNNNFIAISAGDYHNLALKSDRSIVAWGWNNYGQATPPSGNNFIAISAGFYHNLALKSDGSIAGWGDNGEGEAMPPSDNNNFIAISAGYNQSLALKSDGSIVAWGRNDYGQATPPSDNNNFVAISAGGRHNLALKSDGSLVAWGYNGNGECNVPAGNNFVAISAGGLHSLAIFLTPAVAALSITPSDGLSSSGVQGGPFSPGSKAYTLTNTSEQSLAWTADKTQSWLTLDQTSGTLVGGASTTVTVSINSNTNSLSPGDYSDTVSFTNTTNGSGDTTRSVALHVIIVPGTITGIVRSDSNGLPIANIWVEATDYETDNWGGGDNTDSNGFYEITNLPTGNYRVRAWTTGTQYVSEFYDNQLNQDWATPVTVSEGQQTTGIDFSLELGASISGVVKNSSGVGQANVNVNCGADNGYGTGTQTEANGFYKCDGLPVGYNYNVVAYPPPDSNYMITGISVGVYQPGEYTGKDIVLGNGGLKISGRVTDKATTLPLADVRVSFGNNDLEIWTDTRTDENGMYALTNLPPGNVEIRAEPESYYAWRGTNFELTGDINNLDFPLPAGAILCGKVLDAKTAEPLAGVEIEYSNERYAVNRNLSTDADGTFCLTQLPQGIGEVKAKPDVESGYAWNLPWASDWVCLNEGENRSRQIITLEKGALVRGYIKDVNGNAISGIEYYYSGKKCDGQDDADDVNGSYQIRLPVGIYGIALDNEELGALSKTVTITDINKDVNVPDMIVYTEGNGGQISGEVKNPGGYAKTGQFEIIAFKAGTAPNDPNAWYTVQPIDTWNMENAGPFSLHKLPPDANYDIYLCVDNYVDIDIEWLAVQDAALNVSIGTTNINLEYSSQGSTVRGTLKNVDDRPVLGAKVILLGSSGFRGFGDADCNGQYVIYNAPAGTYTATAVHSKYLNASTTVNVIDGIPADVNTIIMPFAGEKEGADLNGDGVIDMLDVTEFCETWLQSGSSEADFNQDNRVNFRDWARMAENWLSNAIWYQE